MYNEIKELYDYCIEKGVKAAIAPLYDGYQILFERGGDFVQHNGSYGSKRGCVEPAIGCMNDYTAVDIELAKLLVDKYYCEKL